MVNIISRPCGPYRVNTYIIYDDAKNAIVIDPASENYISSTVSDLSLSVKCILLTHGHFDHIWSLSDTAIQLGCNSVLVHENDKDMLTDNNKNAYYECGGKRDCIFGHCTGVLKDGDLLSFGDLNITVLSTPGHTPGSVCYLCDNNLFSGDTLFSGSYGRCDLTQGSFADIKKSLKKLKELYYLYGDMNVYPGHGDNTTLGAEIFNIDRIINQA